MDRVVQGVAVIGRGVEPRGPPAEPVVVCPADDVLSVLRIDVERGLVLREAGVVVIRSDVAAGVAQLLDLILRELTEWLRVPAFETGRRALRERVAKTVEVLVGDRPG